VKLTRLHSCNRLSSISAILLLITMFFHWYGVEASNTSNLLFAIQSTEPGKNAWEALDFIPVFLLLTSTATLGVSALYLVNAVRSSRMALNAMVAILGCVSTLLIAYRILKPPVFGAERTITLEGTVQFPIVLALLAATGIAVGGWWAMREDDFSFPDLFPHRTEARRGSTHD
jgi:hypothetical protein